MRFELHAIGLLVKTFIQLFKALNANQHPGQIALGFTLGMIMGLTPLFFPHTLVTLVLLVFLRVNFAAFVVAWGVFSALAYMLDPWFDQLGYVVLTLPGLVEFWTAAYNNAFWRWLAFNNTLVMGSLLIAYSFALPFFILSWWLIRVYRQRLLAWAQRFKIVQLLSASDKASLVSRFIK